MRALWVRSSSHTAASALVSVAGCCVLVVLNSSIVRALEDRWTDGWDARVHESGEKTSHRASSTRIRVLVL